MQLNNLHERCPDAHSMGAPPPRPPGTSRPQASGGGNATPRRKALNEKCVLVHDVGPPEAVLHEMRNEGAYFKDVGPPEAMLHPDAMF